MCKKLNIFIIAFLLANHCFTQDKITNASNSVKSKSLTISGCTPTFGTLTGDSICTGQAGYLTFHPTTSPVNPPLTLVYTDGATTYSEIAALPDVPFIVPVPIDSTTTYPLVKITDAGGCVTNITGIQTTINVIQSLHFIATPDTSICANGDVQLYVSGGSLYTWSPAAYLNDPNIANPIAHPPQPTLFFVSGKDLHNCSIRDSVMVNFLPVRIFNAPRDQAVCAGAPFVLNNNNDPGDSFSWSPADLLNDPNSPAPVAVVSQNTVFHLNISDSLCAQYDSSFDVQVQVSPAPVVTASKSNDIDCSILSSHLNATGAVSYSWIPGNDLDDSTIASPVATLPVTTHFILQGKGTNGCFGYDTLTVSVFKTGENSFSVPNAFTPNNDGLNDCFGVHHWGSVTLQEFSIYNRWGMKVFETKNPSDCWDGTFHGQLQDAGGYVYIIKATSFCGSIVRKGNLLLIR